MLKTPHFRTWSWNSYSSVQQHDDQTAKVSFQQDEARLWQLAITFVSIGRILDSYAKLSIRHP